MPNANAETEPESKRDVEGPRSGIDSLRQDIFRSTSTDDLNKAFVSQAAGRDNNRVKDALPNLILTDGSGAQQVGDQAQTIGSADRRVMRDPNLGQEGRIGGSTDGEENYYKNRSDGLKSEKSDSLGTMRTFEGRADGVKGEYEYKGDNHGLKKVRYMQDGSEEQVDTKGNVTNDNSRHKEKKAESINKPGADNSLSTQDNTAKAQDNSSRPQDKPNDNVQPVGAEDKRVMKDQALGQEGRIGGSTDGAENYYRNRSDGLKSEKSDALGTMRTFEGRADGVKGEYEYKGDNHGLKKVRYMQDGSEEQVDKNGNVTDDRRRHQEGRAASSNEAGADNSAKANDNSSRPQDKPNDNVQPVGAEDKRVMKDQALGQEGRIGGSTDGAENYYRNRSDGLKSEKSDALGTMRTFEGRADGVKGEYEYKGDNHGLKKVRYMQDGSEEQVDTKGNVTDDRRRHQEGSAASSNEAGADNSAKANDNSERRQDKPSDSAQSVGTEDKRVMKDLTLGQEGRIGGSTDGAENYYRNRSDGLKSEKSDALGTMRTFEGRADGVKGEYEYKGDNHGLKKVRYMQDGSEEQVDTKDNVTDDNRRQQEKSAEINSETGADNSDGKVGDLRTGHKDGAQAKVRSGYRPGGQTHLPNHKAPEVSDGNRGVNDPPLGADEDYPPIIGTNDSQIRNR